MRLNLQNETEIDFSDKLIGSSMQMNAVFNALTYVQDVDTSILLQGESGTGKDLIATTIHKQSKRAKKPFVAINCGAIPRDLIESELFGHEKGAFTGAQDQRIGKFELANGGTLFLDEIAELPIDLQVKLLRTLQNKQVERVGGEKQINIDVQIIAATNKNLKEAVNKKEFRLDLYYRLNKFPIQIPSLNERKEDIEALSLYFIEKYAKKFKFEIPTITKEAIQYLQHQRWEGNIRELENLIERSVILSRGSEITSKILRIIPGKDSLGPITQIKKEKPTLNTCRSVSEINKEKSDIKLKNTLLNNYTSVSRKNRKSECKSIQFWKKALKKDKVSSYELDHYNILLKLISKNYKKNRQLLSAINTLRIFDIHFTNDSLKNKALLYYFFSDNNGELNTNSTKEIISKYNNKISKIKCKISVALFDNLWKINQLSFSEKSYDLFLKNLTPYINITEFSNRYYIDVAIFCNGVFDQIPEPFKVSLKEKSLRKLKQREQLIKSFNRIFGVDIDFNNFSCLSYSSMNHLKEDIELVSNAIESKKSFSL